MLFKFYIDETYLVLLDFDSSFSFFLSFFFSSFSLSLNSKADWAMTHPTAMFCICGLKRYWTQLLSNLHLKQVLKFSQQQRTLVATMRRFSVMKKESSVTRDIKLQAESLHRRLDSLSKQVQRTEDLQGPAAVTTRIQRSQHAALYRKFQQVGKMLLPLCCGNFR